MRFELTGDSLCVITEHHRDSTQSSVLRLSVPLPIDPPALATEDLAWIVEQLARVTPAGLFDELKQQNRELLQALADCQVCRAELDKLRKHLQPPAAA